MNLSLKVALIQAGKRQIDLARQTGLGESTISRIINSYRTPTDAEKEKIARALRCEVQVLWPEEESTSVNT
jgi:transcriptional regulator with XRE-family HTH domain